MAVNAIVNRSGELCTLHENGLLNGFIYGTGGNEVIFTRR